MLTKPPASERTPRHHDQVIGGGSGHGGADEFSADAPAPERVGHAGVHEDQPARLDRVDELGERTVEVDDEAVLGRNVAHLRLRAAAHART